MCIRDSRQTATTSQIPPIPPAPPIPPHMQQQPPPSSSTAQVPSLLSTVIPPPNVSSPSDTLELLMCFDSNGKHIDRKKLWKKNNSEYRQCGSLHIVSEQIKKMRYKTLKYLLISIVRTISTKKIVSRCLGGWKS